MRTEMNMETVRPGTEDEPLFNTLNIKDRAVRLFNLLNTEEQIETISFAEELLKRKEDRHAGSEE